MVTRRRMGFVAALNTACVLGAAAVFWWEDVRYSLPTPRPAAVRALAPSEHVALPAAVPVASDRPTLLHFFNHRCSCSRFNATHLNTLVQRFGARVQFVAVAEGSADAAEARLRASGIGLSIPAIADPDGQIAHAAGVWSTPQAALISPDGRLLFRGNYNTSRYHTDRRTEFVRLALEQATGAPHTNPLLASIDALIAWGCQLPADEEAE
jgi:AhpC/TSA family